MTAIASYLSSRATKNLLSLASTYGFDLQDPDEEIYLRLEQTSYMPLVLEKQEKNIFSLSHYYSQNGDLMSDPDVTFLLYTANSKQILIYPLTFTQSNLGIYREVAFVNSERNCLTSFKSRGLKDLTLFCNQWLDNIKAQAWFLDNNQPNSDLTVIKY